MGLYDQSSFHFSVYLTAVQSRSNHDHVIKWKHFPHYWPFVRGIHGHRWIPRTKASDAEFWFLFDLRWANSWASNRYAGGLKRYRAHYDVTVMYAQYSPKYAQWISRSLPDGLRYGVVRGYHMMTSSNGNIFRVTGLLWGEFTGHRWIPATKVSNAELWCFFNLVCAWTNGWANNRDAGDLRRHCAHYDFTVMILIWILPQLLPCCVGYRYNLDRVIRGLCLHIRFKYLKIKIFKYFLFRSGWHELI